VITQDEVMDRILMACPIYAKSWDPADQTDENGEDRLLYCEASDLCRYLEARLDAHEDTELAEAFALIEALHVEGDAWVRNLATIGFLESLWPDERYLPWLEPVSRRWWDRLDRYMRWEDPSALSVIAPPYPAESAS